MSLRRVHPGGFFWTIDRADRDSWILRIAGATGKMVAVASSDSSARRLAERLTLSGVPVLLALGPKTDAFATYAADDVSSLVTTADTLERHDVAVHGPMAVYTKVAESSRDYARLLEQIAAPVHVSFVYPETAPTAEALATQLSEDDELVVEIESEPLAAVLEHAHTGRPVTVGARRRFLLGR